MLKHNVKFGNTVKKRRRERGITQEAIAELVGVSTVYWGMIERGKYSVTWVIWLKICAVLEIDIAQILEILKQNS